MSGTILSRRHFLAGSAIAAAFAVSRFAHSAELSEDGLHQQPWFLESFLDLKEDLSAAQANGRIFVVLWELKGCPYCKLLHEENFANSTIADYVKTNFDFLQLNLVGSRAVTDFDGKELPEKEMAVRYGVRGTPTLLFFAENEDGAAIEVARAEYLKPEKFYGMLRFVHENGYETIPFDEWLTANPASI
jgi:thioredoxin-related protein